MNTGDREDGGLVVGAIGRLVDNGVRGRGGGSYRFTNGNVWCGTE